MPVLTEKLASKTPTVLLPDAPPTGLQALKGCLRHEGPALTLEQIDQLIEASVMEDFMQSMGWDPGSVVRAADWPPLDDMPHTCRLPAHARQTAQAVRDRKVEFSVPDTSFFRPVRNESAGGYDDRP